MHFPFDRGVALKQEVDTVHFFCLLTIVGHIPEKKRVSRLLVDNDDTRSQCLTLRCYTDRERVTCLYVSTLRRRCFDAGTAM